MKNPKKILEQFDWEFSDYRGLFSTYADINSLHWYPAPFVPQIPAILIEVLSKEADTILDLFAGSGVALLEAAKLNRRFIGVDINPFAIDIMKAKFNALDILTTNRIKKYIKSLNKQNFAFNPRFYLKNNNIHDDVRKWFHPRTLIELLGIHKFIFTFKEPAEQNIVRVLFSSILHRSCAQQEHYTYVTDNCFPKLSNSKYIDAKSLFIDQLHLAYDAVHIFKAQYEMMHNRKWNSTPGDICESDSRNLRFISDNIIDMVITSPPYLGVNDYVRSMRLTNLFFPQQIIPKAIENEIGARRKRARKYALDEYLEDMELVFKEIHRVLKPQGYLALIIGQGRGKVTKSLDVINILISQLVDKYEFDIIYNIGRKIKFRRIQVPGIGSEYIYVLQKRG